MMAAEPAAGDPIGMDVADGMEKLSSNVMNYLVWRYLQESGYGKTAKQLQYQWMGRDQSPEDLPFAKQVKKRWLVYLCQDGLMLDHLQTEVKKCDRQYVFGTDHGRKFSIPFEEPREKKSRVRSTSRVPSTNDREMLNGSPAEPPARRGKGKRKSGGEKRTNGDAMDIDSSTNAAGATDTGTAADAESPLPVIEEMPPISTLEIGESKGTITEKPRDLTASTSFVGLEDGLILEQSTWSPHNRMALLTAGNNHMRVHKISNEVPEDQIYARNTVVDVPSDDYAVRAFCWTEKGSGAFTTMENFKNEDGDEMTQYKMFGFTEFGAKVSLVDSTAGMVLGLDYNPESELLVSLSYGEQAHVKVWSYSETIYENSKRRVEPRYELKASKTMGGMLYGVEWTSPHRFIVCGKNAIELYEVEDDIQLVKSVPTSHEWVRMAYDPVYDMAALHDQEMTTLGLVTWDGDDLKLHTQTFDYRILDVAFQPIHSKPFTPEQIASIGDSENATPSQKTPSRILAAATDTGHVYLYNALLPSGPVLVDRLEMSHEATPQALSFSHDGFLLVAAGYDTLNIWKVDHAGGVLKCVWRKPHGEDERWKSDEEPKVNGVGGYEGENGGLEEETDRFVHKLGWDADGKRIAWGMNGQVAVIRL